MSPTAAAVVAQVIPVLFIAAFISAQRVTRMEKAGVTIRIVTITALLTTPILEIVVLDHVIKEETMAQWVTNIVFIVLMLLALSMFGAALEGFKPDQKTDSNAAAEED